MTTRILIRPGADPEAVKALREKAQALGFEIREQARVGRLPVTARLDPVKLAEIVRQVQRKRISLREGARRLGIGAATLHRLLRTEEPIPARPLRQPP